MPEEQAKIYSNRLNQGDYLGVIEAAEDQIQIAEPILDRWGIRSWRIYDTL